MNDHLTWLEHLADIRGADLTHDTRPLLEVVQVGAGGIAHWLRHPLCHDLSIRAFDGLLPTVLHIWDGDDFEERNTGRYGMARRGNKAVALKAELDSLYRHDRFQIRAHPRFLAPLTDDRKKMRDVRGVIHAGQMLVCVPDNHQARGLVHERLMELPDGIAIYAGNSRYQAWAHLHIRKDNWDVTPPLTRTVSELFTSAENANPWERRERVQHCHEQMAVTNQDAAQAIRILFQLLAQLTVSEEIPFYFICADTKTGARRVEKGTPHAAHPVGTEQRQV